MCDLCSHMCVQARREGGSWQSLHTNSLSFLLVVMLIIKYFSMPILCHRYLSLHMSAGIHEAKTNKKNEFHCVKVKEDDMNSTTKDQSCSFHCSFNSKGLLHTLPPLTFCFHPLKLPHMLLRLKTALVFEYPQYLFEFMCSSLTPAVLWHISPAVRSLSAARLQSQHHHIINRLAVLIDLMISGCLFSVHFYSICFL